jgi:hypothetical protein
MDRCGVFVESGRTSKEGLEGTGREDGPAKSGLCEYISAVDRMI